MTKSKEQIEQDHIDATLRDHGIDPVALGKRGEALARVCLANEELKNVLRKIFPHGHDVVCNGSRDKPVGVRNNACSCLGRLERRLQAADVLATCICQAIDNMVSSEWQTALDEYKQISSCQGSFKGRIP